MDLSQEDKIGLGEAVKRLMLLPDFKLIVQAYTEALPLELMGFLNDDNVRDATVYVQLAHIAYFKRWLNETVDTAEKLQAEEEVIYE